MRPYSTQVTVSVVETACAVCADTAILKVGLEKTACAVCAEQSAHTEHANSPIYPLLLRADAHAHARDTHKEREPSVCRVCRDPVMFCPSSYWDAFHWVLSKTSHLDGWIRRRCRREAVTIMRRELMRGDPPAALKAAYLRWQAVPWASLPPDLPRFVEFEESAGAWMDRCYAAGGWHCWSWDSQQMGKEALQ